MKIINNISSATLRIIYGNRNNQICHFFDFLFSYYRVTVSLHFVQRSSGRPSAFFRETPIGFVCRKKEGVSPLPSFPYPSPWVNFDGITGSLSRLSRALLPFLAERGWYHWKVSVS